jgi:hypothetical protein
VHIGDVQSEVRPVQEAPADVERIVEAKLAERERRMHAERQARAATELWHSVRAGSGR